MKQLVGKFEKATWVLLVLGGALVMVLSAFAEHKLRLLYWLLG